MVRLFVGLGNPGTEYVATRHNAGFWAVEWLAQHYGASVWKTQFGGLATTVTLAGDKVLLLKPQTYMNRSGGSVQAAMAFYKLPPDAITVFHDELDIPPATIRTKTGGGAAGHNGLKSIDAAIGKEYHRVRLGIGRPPEKHQVTDYVLGVMPPAEREALMQAFAQWWKTQG
jgi:PTH1 family peptidyl-tRNA hydrolase